MRPASASFPSRLSVVLAVGSLLVLFLALPAETRERDRTLKLYFGHTGEKAEFTFKRNGRYDREMTEYPGF